MEWHHESESGGGSGGGHSYSAHDLRTSYDLPSFGPGGWEQTNTFGGTFWDSAKKSTACPTRNNNNFVSRVKIERLGLDGDGDAVVVSGNHIRGKNFCHDGALLVDSCFDGGSDNERVSAEWSDTCDGKTGVGDLEGTGYTENVRGCASSHNGGSNSGVVLPVVG